MVALFVALAWSCVGPGEQGQSGQQGVAQREVGLTTLVGDLLKALPRQLHQSVKVEVLPLLPLAGSLAHGTASHSTTATAVPPLMVYENRRRQADFAKLFSTRRELLVADQFLALVSGAGEVRHAALAFVAGGPRRIVRSWRLPVC
jgi:hypothetical protein